LHGHVQNPAIANFGDDLPGLEAVSVNFWGNQGIVHFYDAEGDIYHDFEPFQHGSMCLPINWTGSSEEQFLRAAGKRFRRATAQVQLQYVLTVGQHLHPTGESERLGATNEGMPRKLD
jgi:hypothetical protein